MESSWPWDGTTEGDAVDAPYDEQAWGDLERLGFGSGGNVGVLSNPYDLNRLAVTERGAGANMSVDVDTGAALVYGKWYKNTATVNLTIAANASGNPRIDRVVVCMNRQSTAYTGVTPNIDPKTARLAVLQGTPAGSPSPPALTQNAGTVYMVPLAQVYVANGAASITNSNITDEREFAADGSLVLLREVVLSAAASSVELNDIPGGYRHLLIVAQVRSDRAAAAATMAMRFNGDTGNNYDWLSMNAVPGAAPTVTGNANDNNIELPDIPGSTATANYASGVVVEIPNYAGTTFYKTVQSRNNLLTSRVVGNLHVYQGAGWWGNTAAITDIEFSCTLGDNFVAGSTFTLYGRV